VNAQPHRPLHLIVTALSWHAQPVTLTMVKHPTRALPKSAVKLSPSVWYMAKTGTSEAQVLTRYLDWAYYAPAKQWNPNACIQPRIELIPTTKENP
jgi:hypothetical protein